MKELVVLILLVTIFNNIPLIWMLNHNNMIWTRPPRSDNLNMVETMNYKFVGDEIPGASQHCEPEKCAEVCQNAIVNSFSNKFKNYICTHFSYSNGKCTLFQVFLNDYPLSMEYSENTYSGMLLDRMPKWDLSLDGGLASHDKMECELYDFDLIRSPLNSKTDCSGTCVRDENCKSFQSVDVLKGLNEQWCKIGSRIFTSLLIIPSGFLKGFEPAASTSICGFVPGRNKQPSLGILLDNGYTEQVLWTPGYAVAGIEGASFKTFENYTNIQCMESCKNYSTSCLYFSKSDYIDAKGANRSDCILYAGQQSYPFNASVMSYNAGDSSGIFLDRIPKWNIGMRSTTKKNSAKTEWMGQVTWSDRCIIATNGSETTIKKLTKEECAIKCLAKNDCIFFNWNRDSKSKTTGTCQMLSAASLFEIAYYKIMPDLMCGFIMARFQAPLQVQ